ncbi:MAG TPA: deoxyribonuclease IV [Candidatus Methylomirabilis sp.]|nr:deoxyribonuclease IV [Candidatus Methylomirabilis sp.]
MKFGAHVSIAGGVQNAPLNAAKIGCEIFQMFSRSPQGGPAPKLTDTVVASFHDNCRTGRLSEWVIHAPYYINLASGAPTIRMNSGRIVREELERGTVLGAAYVMFHPGSAKDVGEPEGSQLVVETMKRLLDGYSGTTKLLIEISAGAGMIIGDTFEEVAEILNGVDNPDVGVCFDTAHAFASGYDLRDKKAIDATMKKFDETIGLKRLKMSHCNDSKVELGAHKDRHEHLGDGFIGAKGFKELVRHPAWKDINLYLETEPDEVAKDLAFLKKARQAS